VQLCCLFFPLLLPPPLLVCCGVLAPHQVCACVQAKIRTIPALSVCFVLSAHQSVCVCVQADGGSNAENLAPNVVLSSLFTSSYVCVPDYLTSLYVSVCRPMEAAMQRI